SDRGVGHRDRPLRQKTLWVIRGLKQTGVMTLVRRALALSITFTAASFAADWDRRLAAEFLDGRQKQWFEWRPSQRAGGPCGSCHTGLTYLLARPALRGALGETAPATYEQGLTQGCKTRLVLGMSQFPT